MSNLFFIRYTTRAKPVMAASFLQISSELQGNK